jgi:hypothetical protein
VHDGFKFHNVLSTTLRVVVLADGNGTTVEIAFLSSRNGF